MSIDTALSRLAEQQMRSAQVLDRAAAQHTPLSPCHSAPLLGSAARWCSQCARTVPAWLLDHETHAPLTGGAR